MNDAPIGKAMVQDGSGAILDECAVFARSRDATALTFRFERELVVGDGQKMVLDVWQHSGEVAAPQSRAARPAYKKENGDA